MVAQDHLLERFIHCKIEADVWNYPNDRWQPPPPQRDEALLCKDMRNERL